MADLTAFQIGYVSAALAFTSHPDDESGDTTLDRDFEIDDIHPASLAALCQHCNEFEAAHADDLETVEIKLLGAEHYAYRDRDRQRAEQAGHDLWMTSNRHGVGFWDGDYGQPQASRLTEGAHKLGQHDIYPGDDGVLYLMGAEP